MSEEARAPVAGGQVERITGDTLIARRDYLRILVTISGGLVLGAAAVVVGLFPKRTGSATALRIAAEIPAGAYVQFAYPSGDDRAIAMRLPDGTLVAYSSICTHLSCAVLPRLQEAALVCPCHDGRFDARTGDVLEGPPPRPLPQVLVEQRSDGIYAVGAVAR
jgi:Rieske Fe-S protein